jgi:predicted RNase H-like HicB family nuclease
MRTFSVVITEEDNWLVALEPTTGVASQGKTLDEAMHNIREALELYFEESGEKSTKQDNHHTFLTTVTV